MEKNPLKSFSFAFDILPKLFFLFPLWEFFHRDQRNILPQRMCEVPLDEYSEHWEDVKGKPERFKRVLFHYSNEKKDFSLAIQEWRYHTFYEKQWYELASGDGKVAPEEGDDAGPQSSHCICSQHFMIVHVVQHRETNVRLPIGSESSFGTMRTSTTRCKKICPRFVRGKENENRKKKRGSRSGSGIDSVWIALASISSRRHLTGKYVAFHVGNWIDNNPSLQWWRSIMRRRSFA